MAAGATEVAASAACGAPVYLGSQHRGYSQAGGGWKHKIRDEQPAVCASSGPVQPVLFAAK